MDLKEAIAQGQAERAAREQKEQEQKRAQRALAEQAFNAEVQRLKVHYESTIFELVKNAVARGETSLALRAGEAAACAINQIPGFSAFHESGFDNINSDEVKEEWHCVTVTWKEPK